jgi:hypothetical protein
MSKRPKCLVPSCDRDRSSKGYCSAHYLRWLTTGDVRANVPIRPRGPRQPPGQLCSVESCGRLAVAKSFCPGHLYRKHRFGDPMGHIAFGDHKIRKEH